MIKKTLSLTIKTLLLLSFFIPSLAIADSTKSILVTYFDNCSPTKEWHWLRKGITDILIIHLSSYPDLQVIDREDLSQYLEEMELTELEKFTPSIAQDLGKKANVELVIIGNFLKQGDKININASLIEVSSGNLLKTEQVDGLAKDVGKLEEELVSKIIQYLDIKLIQTPSPTPIKSIDSATHFYTGIDYYENNKYIQALAEFQRAIEKDEDYKDAWYWMAKVYSSIGDYNHAIITYQKIIEKFTDEDKALYQIGIIYEQEFKKFDEALKYYIKIINKYPLFKLPVDEMKSRLGREFREKYKLPLLTLDRIILCYEKLNKLIKAYNYSLKRYYFNKWCFQPSPFQVTHYLTSLHQLYSKIINQYKEELVTPPEEIIIFNLKNPIYKYPDDGIKYVEAGKQQYFIFQAPHKYQILSVTIELKLGTKSKCYPVVSKYPEILKIIGGDRGNMDEFMMSTIIGTTKETSYKKDTLIFPTPVRIFCLHFMNKPQIDIKWQLSAKLSTATPTIMPIHKEADFRVLYKDWTEPIQILSMNANNISLIQDKNACFWLAYDEYIPINAHIKREGNYNIWLTYSQNGIDWEEPIKLSINSSSLDYNPVLIQDNKGIFRLIWVSNRTGENELWTATSKDGIAWDYPINLSKRLNLPEDIHTKKANVCIGFRGTFGFIEDMTGKFILITESAVTTSIDGLIWDEPVLLIDEKYSFTSDVSFVLTQDNKGTYWLVSDHPSPYYSPPHPFETIDIMLTYSKDAIKWGKPFFVAYPDKYSNQKPYLLCDNKGKYYLIFSHTGRLAMATSTDGYNWCVPKKVFLPMTSGSSIVDSVLIQTLDNKYMILWSTTGKGLWMSVAENIEFIPIPTKPSLPKKDREYGLSIKETILFLIVLALLVILLVKIRTRLKVMKEKAEDN